MKLATQFLAASTLALAVGSAFAVDGVANIKIKGKIGIGSCTISSTTPDNTVTYDMIAKNSLTRESNPIGTRNMTLTVDCSAITGIKIYSQDAAIAGLTGAPSNADFQFSTGGTMSVSNVDSYNLAATNASAATEKKIVGKYVMKASDIKVTSGVSGETPLDATLVDSSTESGFGSGASTNQYLTKTAEPYHKLALKSNAGTTAYGKTFVIPVEIATSLVKNTSLPTPATGDDLEFEGVATLTVSVL
ncbi:DUF1120 domain-containing protein [Herbaspirillum sp. RTI4]|uniref:DUF1120 domain-containing protein n=1 Tax=Herbaspirillum sp. RTI4 TaxID=3048640 RepID=UPI002AB440F5|nr:DUF1120 domain-containing protein [Herbaspirillum sp. RTI4]MDY7577734.1 DUF1120 domain-containing protein [Herbaspirillum sp. RTI4]MEA9980838.1 DUF1120 domain-containing protein [Herbaspirillum sp. RTI4]